MFVHSYKKKPVLENVSTEYSSRRWDQDADKLPFVRLEESEMDNLPVGFQRIIALKSSVYSSSVQGSFRTPSIGVVVGFSTATGSVDVVSWGVEAALILARFRGGILNS
jgi:hypothetical protein